MVVGKTCLGEGAALSNLWGTFEVLDLLNFYCNFFSKNHSQRPSLLEEKGPKPFWDCYFGTTSLPISLPSSSQKLGPGPHQNSLALARKGALKALSRS